MQINAIQGSSVNSGTPVKNTKLTEEQKSQVASILANYDAASLTAQDARAINDAFRDAGIRRGSGLREAIEDEGFDGEKIRSLAPPPEEGPGQMGPPPPQGNAELNTHSLLQLQEILNNYDLENLSSNDEKNLLNQLNQADLLFPGLIINIST